MTPFNPDGRLVFEHAAHAYRLAPTLPDEIGGYEGRPRALISVTKVFEEALDGTLGEEYWTEESRLRGSAIHSAVLFYVQHDLDESTLHPAIAPYWGGVVQMFKDEQPDVLHAEEPIYDEGAGYAGTFDLLCRLKGARRALSPKVLDLLDAKTGIIPWTVGLQTAAYKRAIQRVYPDHVIRRWAWQLTSAGTYKLEEVSRWSDARDHERKFLAVLLTAQLKREHTPCTHQ